MNAFNKIQMQRDRVIVGARGKPFIVKKTMCLVFLASTYISFKGNVSREMINIECSHPCKLTR